MCDSSPLPLHLFTCRPCNPATLPGINGAISAEVRKMRNRTDLVYLVLR